MKKFIKLLIKNLLTLEFRIRGRRMKFSPWRAELIRMMGYGRIYRHTFYVDINKKIVYMQIPKAANTPLKGSFFETEKMREGFIKNRRELRMQGDRSLTIENIAFDKNKSDYFTSNINIAKNLLDEGIWIITGRHPQKGFRRKEISLEYLNSNFIFTFVRNPFTKLATFFRDKYQFQDNKYISSLGVVPDVKTVSSFDDLARKIYKLPDFLLEIHSTPQYPRIESFIEQGGKFDFIGKFDNLDEEFEPIRQRFNLLPLPHENKTLHTKKDWRDYYTPKATKLVYKRYRKDFEMFGYEDEYPKLLDYLKFQSKREA